MRVACLVAVLGVVGVSGVGLAAGPRLVDAVVAEVAGGAVTLSEVALARALGLFGLEPSTAPIGAPDVDRYLDGALLAREARALGIEGSPGEVEQAWDAVDARLGGPGALARWLWGVGAEEAWGREMVEAELRRRRFVELRFRAFAFVSEAEVAARLGPGPHDEAARARARARLEDAAVRRQLDAWLTEARGRVSIRRLLGDGDRLPDPFAGGAPGAVPAGAPATRPLEPSPPPGVRR